MYFENYINPWRHLITYGEERAQVRLSELQNRHLEAVFIKIHYEEDQEAENSFWNKLHNVKVIHMQCEALEREGTSERISALIDVGDACLMRAGFPRKLITKGMRRANNAHCANLINVGKACFETVSRESRRGQYQNSACYELAQGFEDMVEVLWACQQEGYPEKEELVYMHNASFRCATNTLNRLEDDIVWYDFVERYPA